MPWRTEPEIALERQIVLEERRQIKPDVDIGIYPFRDKHGPIKLNRADLEWLLATHESTNVRGSVVGDDSQQRIRHGLCIQGADLSDQNLANLPLSNLQAGLDLHEWMQTTRIEDELAGCHFERAVLTDTDLQGACLTAAHFEDAVLKRTRLQRSILAGAHLDGARLDEAHLELSSLNRAHLTGTYLTNAYLAGCDLRSAFFTSETTLRQALLSDADHGSVAVADVRWRDVNLAVVRWRKPRTTWQRFPILGDEHVRRLTYPGENSLAHQYGAAVRANRQIAVVLRAQGLNEEADHFSYRAHIVQRRVYLRRFQLPRLVLSPVRS